MCVKFGLMVRYTRSIRVNSAPRTQIYNLISICGGVVGRGTCRVSEILVQTSTSAVGETASPRSNSCSGASAAIASTNKTGRTRATGSAMSKSTDFACKFFHCDDWVGNHAVDDWSLHVYFVDLLGSVV